MSYSGLSGQYGTMPMSIMAQKFEATDIEEDPEALDDHMRTALKDMRCSAPMFESDFKRDPEASNERLALRYHGARSSELPWRPDEFMDFTEADPRGRLTDPQFYKARCQMESRAEVIKKYPDSFPQIQESAILPSHITGRMHEAWDQVKERLKIFSTSLTVFPGARNFKSQEDSVGDMVEAHVMAPDVTNTQNWTAALSNNVRVGWHTTTDGEFKVAQYGACNKALEGFRGGHGDSTWSAAKQASLESADPKAHMLLTMQNAMNQRTQDNGEESFAVSRLLGVATSRTGATKRQEAEYEAMRIAKYADLATRDRVYACEPGTDLTRQIIKIKSMEQMAMATKGLVPAEQSHKLERFVADANANAAHLDMLHMTRSAQQAGGVDKNIVATARFVESKQVAPLAQIAQQANSTHRALGQEDYKRASKSFIAAKWMRPRVLDHQSGDTGDTDLTANDRAVYDSSRGSMNKFIRDKMVSGDD